MYLIIILQSSIHNFNVALFAYENLPGPTVTSGNAGNVHYARLFVYLIVWQFVGGKLCVSASANDKFGCWEPIKCAVNASPNDGGAIIARGESGVTICIVESDVLDSHQFSTVLVHVHIHVEVHRVHELDVTISEFKMFLEHVLVRSEEHTSELQSR